MKIRKCKPYRENQFETCDKTRRETERERGRNMSVYDEILLLYILVVVKHTPLKST